MYIMVFITVPSRQEAEKIAQGLLNARLAACVNVCEGIESFFWWEGKIDSAKELLLIAKSKKSKLAKIIKTVKSLHSYQVPEIISVPIAAGEKKYLRWIDESVGRQS